MSDEPALTWTQGITPFTPATTRASLGKITVAGMLWMVPQALVDAEQWAAWLLLDANGGRWCRLTDVALAFDLIGDAARLEVGATTVTVDVPIQIPEGPDTLTLPGWPEDWAAASDDDTPA